jgi:hypothetical protein
MPPVSFPTVPQELQPAAYACRAHLQAGGYIVKSEYLEEDFPETATIYGKLGQERHIYILDARIRKERVTLWSGYGRSCSSATFVVLCLPQNAAFSGHSMLQARELGIGISAVSIDGAVREIVPPIDLSMNVALPPTVRHKQKNKRALMKAYTRINRSDWKGGFEEACTVVENAARRYLATSGVVQVVGKKGAPRTVNRNQIKRMPLGALADVFCGKLNQNQIDALLCSGLKRINPDRISVAHGTLTGATERRLRRNINKHLWTIDNLLRKIPA